MTLIDGVPLPPPASSAGSTIATVAEPSSTIARAVASSGASVTVASWLAERGLERAGHDASRRRRPG